MRISLAIRILCSVGLLGALAVLPACMVSSGPVEVIEFDDIHGLERLLGYYRNRGDAGPDAETDVFLSELIWTDRELDHSSIEFLNVTLERSDALRVTALTEGEPLLSEVFVKDRDFVMSKGRISLGSDTEMIGGETPALGATKTRAWLGLEESGHGVYRESWNAAALFGVLPVVAAGREDVRFEHAATVEALMPVANSARAARPDVATVVHNSELEREIQGYIAVFDAPYVLAKEQALETLRWSGIADSRLFDPMEDELRWRYQTTTRSGEDKVAALIRGLSYSGQSRYRASLQKVAAEASSELIKKQASQALLRLEQYGRWNPVILAGVKEAPEGGLNELRIRNMLSASDPTLRRIGAREAYRHFLRNERVVAVANQSMLHEFNRNLTQPNQIDSVLWLMKVVVNSGNSDYVSSFNDIAAASKVTKIAGRAERYAQRLQGYQTAPRFIDIDALLPPQKNLSVAPVRVVSVTDERRFETGIRNASSPSMAEPVASVPAEKRAAFIAVVPRGWNLQREPLVMLSLPLGSSVQGEVKALLEAGLNHRFASQMGQHPDPIALHASIEQFWGWWRTKGFWSLAVEARIRVRLELIGPSYQRAIIYVRGSGTYATQLVTESDWKTAYELAYRDFLANLDDALRQAGL